VRTFWNLKDISHIFHLDSESVSNSNVLQQNSFFSGDPSISNDSGFMCVLNCSLKYNLIGNPPPSVEDLRQDVMKQIEANKDPVVRTIHLNEHCARIHNQAGHKTRNKRSASERYLGPYASIMN
jgi:hypothetical protein